MIREYLKKYRGLLIVALILATINQVFSLLDPQIFRIIVDKYANKSALLAPSVFLKGVFLLLLASMGVALVSRIAKNFQDYTTNYMTQKIGTEMYARSVSHTLSLPYQVFEDQRSGEVLQKLQKARTDTQNAITSFINIAFLSLVGILFVVIYAFTVHWLMGVSYFLLIPIVGGFTYLTSTKIKEAQKSIVAESAALAGSTTETLRNVELVKSLGLEGQEIQRLNAVNEKVLSLELRKIILIRKISFVQGTLVNLMRLLLLFGMLWLIMHQEITLGQFFSLYIYSFFIFGPLAEMGTVASSYQEAKASIEKLDEILKIPPQKKVQDPLPLETLQSVDFKKVFFKYKTGDNPSVKDINLTLTAGKTFAFVGPSGSGKTTLVKLLVGLYQPKEGLILFNGKDSRKLDLEELRKRIGLVSQETQLFAGTIKENLLFVNPKATEKECLEVIKLAAINNLLE